MAMLRRKKPTPVAYCWYLGIELSAKKIREKGCLDRDKQKRPEGICKHIQFYGKKDGGDDCEKGQQLVQGD